MESTLDWLCLNLPPAQLPPSFSTGIRTSSAAGQVGEKSNLYLGFRT